MRVILTEKPSVGRDIGKALGCREERKPGAKGKPAFLTGDGTCVTWAFGHLLEVGDIAPKGWNKDTLPILPETFTYKPTRDGLRQLRAIKGLLGTAKEVVIATDAGREGELIARLILQHAGWKGKTWRFWTSEALSEGTVRKAMGSLRPAREFDSLYYSALARQHADWLVGINMTRAVTLAAETRDIWSVGRVQTPTMAMVVDRDLEREAFVPEPYAVLTAMFETPHGSYKGTSSRMPREKAAGLLNELAHEPSGVVVDVRKERKSTPPPLLHSLTTLQREANREYGLSAQKTLKIAQDLYQQYKCLSYPRTDATHMGDDDLGTVVESLKAVGREDLIADARKVGKRVFDSSKLTDHHALIPLVPCPESASQAHKDVYRLVLRRFLGVFYPDYIYDALSATTRIRGTDFTSSGRAVVQQGWKELYKSSDERLPELVKGQTVKKKGLAQENRQTEPPQAHTEESILTMMEKLGLGTPATRASIIETILSRGYVVREKKLLLSSARGRELIARLRQEGITKPEMTAVWETKLEKIYKQKLGADGYGKFLEDIRQYVSALTRSILRMTFEAAPTVNSGRNRKTSKTTRNGGKRMPQEGEGQEQKVWNNPVVFSCQCGGDVERRPRTYTCTKCGAVLWVKGKDGGPVMGHEWTDDEAKVLFTQGKSDVLQFTGKSGKTFKARMTFVNGKTELEFENSQKPNQAS